ncbi:MAG TPA: NHL repeat-containing protein [Armatimonadota bacterium]|jgi:hypothetical protein
MKHVTWMLALCIPLAARAAAPTPNRVYGQPDDQTILYVNPNMPPAARMGAPRGVAADDTGLYVADRSLSRVLFFPADATVASRVYGQPDFTSTNYNGYGLNADSMAVPWYIDVSKAGLIVTDWRNSRIIFYPTGSTRASLAYGSANLYSCAPAWDGVSPSSLTYPAGCAIEDDGTAYLADSQARVLRCPPGTTLANGVYGPPDLTTWLGGCDAQRIGVPFGLAVDSTGLYVADADNNRVVFFPKGSTTATRVYGQPTFTSNAANNGGVGPNSLAAPMEVATDDTGVYIVDQANYRVLYYPGASTTATYVYGQPDLLTNDGPSGLTSGQKFWPSAVAVDAFSVFISDEYGARVLRYDKPFPTARSMEFAMQPSGGTAGKALPQSPTVRLLHADGSPAVEYNGPVHLRLKAGVGPECALLSGAATAQAVNGVAVFGGLKIDTAGSYVLQATCHSLPVADSVIIPIAAPPASFAADADHDGKLTISDPVLMLRALYGFDALS